MKRLIPLLALTAIVLGASAAFSETVTVQEYTAGKANSDSLGTAADVFSAFKIPDGLASLTFVVMPDTADVLYTCEVSYASALSDSVWTTAFLDTAVAGAYDEHELGAVTGTSGGHVAGITYGGLLPGSWVRLTCDNLDVTIDFCTIAVKYAKD